MLRSKLREPTVIPPEVWPRPFASVQTFQGGR
jgi:hypothetical protein